MEIAIAAVAVDRGRAQPHRCARGERHAAHIDEVGGNPGRQRRRRLKSNDLLDENLDVLGLIAKLPAQLRPARQFEEREPDRRGHRVQTGKNQQVTHAEQLEVAEIARTGHHLRQHVTTRVPPALLDDVGEIRQQLVPFRLAGHGGVLPGDHAISILQRQPIEVHEYLIRVESPEICHRLALVSGGEGRDHFGGVALHHGPESTQGVRAEVRLQDLAVAGVLGRVERRRQHRHRAAGRLKCQVRREEVGFAERRQHVFAGGSGSRRRS